MASVSKEHILAELRRVARQDGGRAPGHRRFRQETGIKPSDWTGTYWARWNDVLKEAGLAPNERTSARTDDDVFGHLRNLVVELGRFPVSAELRLRARQVPGFPSDKTLRRFGGLRALRARLRQHLLEKGDAKAVALLAADPDSDRLLAQAGESELDRSRGADQTWGSVYLLKCGRFYKVGRTNAVGRRERELAIQLPEKASVVHEIKTDDPVGIEGYWHGRFGDRRKNGEWFALTSDDITAFKRRKFM